ncbi:hypothetical protein RJT34_31776 [Clitoria ternatea]|uniref:Uncharacterized protein n=1 Tax=Clitoria ternatea TaxID=43366 RepID=A0AAN9EVM0_CLITE
MSVTMDGGIGIGRGELEQWIREASSGHHGRWILAKPMYQSTPLAAPCGGQYHQLQHKAEIKKRGRKALVVR